MSKFDPYCNRRVWILQRWCFTVRLAALSATCATSDNVWHRDPNRSDTSGCTETSWHQERCVGTWCSFLELSTSLCFSTLSLVVSRSHVGLGRCKTPKPITAYKNANATRQPQHDTSRGRHVLRCHDWLVEVKPLALWLTERRGPVSVRLTWLRKNIERKCHATWYKYILYYL